MYKNFAGLPYEDKVISIFEGLTGVVVDYASFGLAGKTLKKVTGFWKNLPILAEKEAKLFKAVGKFSGEQFGVFEKLLRAIQNSAYNFSEVFLVTAKHGLKKTQKALKFVWESPELLAADKGMFKKVVQFWHEWKHASENFTFNINLSKIEADAFGKKWVGKNAVKISGKKNVFIGWESINKTPDYILKRQYRISSIKSGTWHTGKLVSNFEEFIKVPGHKFKKLKNEHLIIKE